MHAQVSVRLIIRRLIIVALLSIALNGVAAVAAETIDAISGASAMTAGTDGRRHAARMARYADELGLTGQQRTDIQIIMAEYATRFGDLAKLGGETVDSLLSMAPSDPDYRRETDEAAALAASSAAEAVILLAEMRGMLYRVLTVDQRELLRQKLEEAKLQHAAKRRSESGVTTETTD